MFDHWLSKKMEMMKGDNALINSIVSRLGNDQSLTTFRDVITPRKSIEKSLPKYIGGFFKWGYILILVDFFLRKTHQQNSQTYIKQWYQFVSYPDAGAGIFRYKTGSQNWSEFISGLRQAASHGAWVEKFQPPTTFTMASWEIPLEKGSKVGFKMGTSSINQGIFHCHRSRLFILFIKTWSGDAGGIFEAVSLSKLPQVPVFTKQHPTATYFCWYHKIKYGIIYMLSLPRYAHHI